MTLAGPAPAVSSPNSFAYNFLLFSFRHAIAARHEIPTVSANLVTEPPVAQSHTHTRSDLVQRRSPRWQPSSRPANERRREARVFRPARENRFQGDRGRLPERV